MFLGGYWSETMTEQEELNSADVPIPDPWHRVKRYAIYNPDGSIAQIVGCTEKDRDLQFIPDGGAILLVDDDVDWSTHYIRDGAAVAFPPRPSRFHKFSYSRFEWEDPRTIEERQDARWAQLKIARDAAEFGGFLWEGLLFDSNQISQQRIGAACQEASSALALNVPFFKNWTLADNSTVPLSAEQMMSVGLALGNHVGTVHAKGRELRERLYAANSIEGIEAIVW
jgi:hypothetical protein